MAKSKILLQLDTDRQPSVFDSVVAVDAEVDQLFRHGDIQPEGVRDLVYGAIFTRGGEDLRSTAIFIGGSDVSAGERLLKQVEKTFFGPMRVSVMLDSNGANTTAAAAVVCAARHLPLAGKRAVVLAGTGPVGSRVALLLALEGAQVTVASRSLEKAAAVCESVARRKLPGTLTPAESSSPDAAGELLSEAEIVIAAGAPGVQLASEAALQQGRSLKLAIDLSAVPPLGLAGIEVTDKAVERAGVIGYGAIGVGGTKMKIHKAALKHLFTANDLVLDAEQIYRIGQQLNS